MIPSILLTLCNIFCGTFFMFSTISLHFPHVKTCKVPCQWNLAWAQNLSTHARSWHGERKCNEIHFKMRYSSVKINRITLYWHEFLFMCAHMCVCVCVCRFVCLWSLSAQEILSQQRLLVSFPCFSMFFLLLEFLLDSPQARLLLFHNNKLTFTAVSRLSLRI